MKEKAVTDLMKVSGIGDFFDAMTTDRPYEHTLSIFDAMNKLKRENANGELF